jgi:hypothetical protein
MNGSLPHQTTTSLAMEQQSWMTQIDRCLQRLADSAGAENGPDRVDTQEGWQLIERSLRLGAEVLKSMPRLAS